MVQVYVGPGDRCWMLPTNLLCHLSSFFKAALKTGFKEADKKRVVLKDDEPEVFRLFVVWLYSGSVQGMEFPDIWLEKAWIFGDKIGAPAFQNRAMARLIKGYEDEDGVYPFDYQYNARDVDYIYKNTVPGSLLRAATVDAVVYWLATHDMIDKKWKALYSRGGDFVVDLIMKLRRIKRFRLRNPVDHVSDYMVTGSSQAECPRPVKRKATTLVDAGV